MSKYFAVDEMYLASLINKGREVYANGTTNPSVLPAEVVLQMATINGAKSVLWDNEIGSLEVGKKVMCFFFSFFWHVNWPSFDFHFNFYFFSSVLFW